MKVRKLVISVIPVTGKKNKIRLESADRFSFYEVVGILESAKALFIQNEKITDIN